MPIQEWETLNLEARIIEILHDSVHFAPNHHFRRPFMTAYQIAIEFRRRFEKLLPEMHVGGLGTGEHRSLAKEFAWHLSRRIVDEQRQGNHDYLIEGAWLSNEDQHVLSYNHPSEKKPVISSKIARGDNLSMFRLRQ